MSKLLKQLKKEFDEKDKKIEELESKIEELESQLAYECECNKDLVMLQHENEELKEKLYGTKRV